MSTKDKDKIKEYRRKYWMEHKERRKEIARSWYHKHKEERKVYNKEWLEKNKDKRNEYHKKYAKDNKEKIHQRYENNKEKVKKRVDLKRIKYKEEWFSILLNKHMDFCWICGYNKCFSALDFHHIDPKKKEHMISFLLSRKFKDKYLEELDKVVPLCANCHRELHGGIIAIDPDNFLKRKL